MNLVDLVAECVPPQCSGLVIDVGCGEGELIAEISTYLQKALYVGVDIDGPSLGAGVNGVRADAANLPFRNGMADVVAAKGLLHHVDNVKTVVGEMARVVATDGWMFISDGTRLSDDSFAEMNRELRAAGLPTERHPGFEPGRLAKMIADAGLSVSRMILEGEATFATPPFVSRTYSTQRLLIGAHR
jgi:SAM-dependent methyltransferase